MEHPCLCVLHPTVLDKLSAEPETLQNTNLASSGDGLLMLARQGPLSPSRGFIELISIAACPTQVYSEPLRQACMTVRSHAAVYTCSTRRSTKRPSYVPKHHQNIRISPPLYLYSALSPRHSNAQRFLLSLGLFTARETLKAPVQHPWASHLREVPFLL